VTSEQTRYYIELNCDLGEAETPQGAAREAELLPYIQRANVACGGHAGNRQTIFSTLVACRAYGIDCGAHPGYPDRQYFGRKPLDIPFQLLTESLQAQIETLLDVASKAGCDITHIKYHGALYNQLEVDPKLSSRLASWQARLFSNLSVLAMAHGNFLTACQQHGLRTIGEAFIDRRYATQTKLVPRQQSGAVIANIDEAIEQAIRLSKGLPLGAGDSAIHINAQSLCVHGDNPEAIRLLRRLQQRFVAEEIRCARYEP